MKIKTVNGVEIDTNSQIYQDYLRDLQDEAKYGIYPEPSPYLTLKEEMERERRKRQQEVIPNKGAKKTPA
jgi:hypothetical protein